MYDDYKQVDLGIKKAIYEKAIQGGYEARIMDPEAKKMFIERGKSDYEGDDKYMVDFDEVNKLQAVDHQKLIDKKKR